VSHFFASFTGAFDFPLPAGFGALGKGDGEMKPFFEFVGMFLQAIDDSPFFVGVKGAGG